MLAVFSTLIVFAVSLLVIRVATVGLSMTGISKDLAHFQALSAFTGSGFTTEESEDIVNHPLRRRIAMHLMLLGHVGIVVAIPSLLLSFMNTSGKENWTGHVILRGCVLAAGLLILLMIANSRYVEKLLWRINRWALNRLGGIQLHDYTRLLRVVRNYVVSELHVDEGEWLAGHTLEQLRLNHEGVLVLGIERADGEYLGTPRGFTELKVGDCLILYGQQETLVELGDRRAGMEGNVEHMLAVTRQMAVAEEEKKSQSALVDGKRSSN